MAGFDTTDVAAKVNPQAQNPIEVIGGLANAQNAFNQNKLFDAKALAGQYLEQATGPDGQPDLNQFTAALKQDKRTSPFALEILQGTAGLRQTGIQNETQQRALNQASVDELRKATAIYGNTSQATDPKIKASENSKSVLSAITKLVRTGAIDPKIAAQYTGSGDMADDIRAATIGGAGGPDARKAMTGTISTVNTPQGVQSINTNEFNNTVSTPDGDAAFIKNKLSAQDLAAPVDVPDEHGVKTRHVFGEYFDENSNRRSGIALPRIDIGPLSAAAQQTYGAALGQDIDKFEKEASAAVGTKGLIEQMDSAADTMTDPGPHSPFWQKVGELASEYHIKDFDPNDTKTSAAEKFNKIIPALIRQQAVMLGMSDTDTGRQIAALTVPGQTITREGIHTISAILKGNADAITAQGKVWKDQKAKNGEKTFGDFRVQFPQEFPPTIFQSQYMTTKEIKDMQKGWSKDQLDLWTSRKAIAKKQGWLPNVK